MEFENSYLITFSPKENTINVQFSYIDMILKYFIEFNYCMKDFEIYPELNQNGNIHFHGWFILKDKIKWFKRVLPRMKRNGFIKINQIKTDFNKAIEYCKKDKELMQKLIPNYNIPFKHNDKIKCHEMQKQDNLLDYINIVSDNEP